MNQQQRLISRKEAAVELGIKEQTLAAWACNKRYQLPYVKVGRRAMYKPTDLGAFIEMNRIGGTEEGQVTRDH